MIEVADHTLLPVQQYGGLKLKLQQPGGMAAVTLPNVTPVSALGRNLLSRHLARSPRGKEATPQSWHGGDILQCDGCDAARLFSFNPPYL